jgi:hypothetical protein
MMIGQNNLSTVWAYRPFNLPVVRDFIALMMDDRRWRW